MVPKGSLFLLLLGGLAIGALALAPSALESRTSSTNEGVGHVFVIVLENKDYNRTFAAQSEAPYLGNELPREGRLLTEYYGVGYRSLVNYIAMVSGQVPNNQTKENCAVFSDFTEARIVDGIAAGEGCVYPAEVLTIADQLEAAGLSWRMYGEDMALSEPTRCRHPDVGATDPWFDATPTDQYATRHVPFVYFHSIIDDIARCEEHVVDLEELRDDLRSIESTPAFSYITPDLCSDGHDWECPDGSPGGYAGIERFLREWVPLIQESEAYRKDGLVIVTFDENDTRDGPDESATKPWTLQEGFGGGHIGAVLLAPCLPKGSEDATPYNHFGLLHTFANLFGQRPLGRAAAAQPIDLAGCEDA